jgi:tetratricopeptide (TPR) repeat protein
LPLPRQDDANATTVRQSLDVRDRKLLVNHVQRSGALLFSFVLFLGSATAQKQQPSGQAADLLRTALQSYQQGKYDEALAKCKQSIALDPKEYRAHVLLGYIYGAQQKLDLASQSLDHAIKLEPKDKEVYLLKAQIDFFRNKRPEALAAAQKAVALDPNYGEAHLMVGTLLKEKQNRETEAIAELRKAIELNPQLVGAYDDLGDLLNEMKRPKEAEAVYRQGILADPKRMAGRFNLGRMLVAQGRLDEARELWTGRTSDEDRIMPSFITVLTRAENMKRAKEAIIANPNDPDALVDMGLAVMDGDHWVIDDRQKRAIVLFKKALDVKPDYPRAQHAIVKAYIELADNDDTENKNVDLELARLRKLDPKLAAEMDQYRKTYQGGLITTDKP